jgi:hypothetical protein
MRAVTLSQPLLNEEMVKAFISSAKHSKRFGL